MDLGCRYWISYSKFHIPGINALFGSPFSCSFWLSPVSSAFSHLQERLISDLVSHGLTDKRPKPLSSPTEPGNEVAAAASTGFFPWGAAGSGQICCLSRGLHLAYLRRKSLVLLLLRAYCEPGLQSYYHIQAIKQVPAVWYVVAGCQLKGCPLNTFTQLVIAKSGYIRCTRS